MRSRGIRVPGMQQFNLPRFGNGGGGGGGGGFGFGGFSNPFAQGGQFGRPAPPQQRPGPGTPYGGQPSAPPMAQQDPMMFGNPMMMSSGDTLDSLFSTCLSLYSLYSPNPPIPPTTFSTPHLSFDE